MPADGGAPACVAATRLGRAMATNPKTLASAAASQPRRTHALARPVARARGRRERVNGCRVAGWGGGASDGPANPTLDSVATSSKTNSSGTNSSTSCSTSSPERNSTRCGFRCGKLRAPIVGAARRRSGGGAERGGFGRGGAGISHERVLLAPRNGSIPGPAVCTAGALLGPSETRAAASRTALTTHNAAFLAPFSGGGERGAHGRGERELPRGAVVDILFSCRFD